MSTTDAVAGACALVPPYWPLTHFVAVNPFVGLSDRSFAEAERLLDRVGHAQLLADAPFYLNALAESRGDSAGADHDLNALARSLDAPSPQRERLHAATDLSDLLRPSVPGWHALIVDEISKWCASYYDQGQAAWGMPWRDRSLFVAWKTAAIQDLNPELMGLHGFRQHVASCADDPRQVIEQGLAAVGVPLAARQDYLHRLLMSVSGWSGYIQHRVRQASMNGDQSDELVQLLAVRFVFDVAVHAEHSTNRIWQERWAAQFATANGDAGSVATDVEARHAAQRTLEHRYQHTLFAKLTPGAPTESVERPALQAVFCIDVRSEVFRRALEAQHPAIQTIGFAGFFGLPLAYRPTGADHASARCPVLLSPAITVEDRSPATGLPYWLTDAWSAFQTSGLSCFAFVETTGLVFGAALARQWFARERDTPAVARHAPGGLDVHLAADRRTGLALAVLQNMGLLSNFAPLVLICGHGSTTTNNPYASSLACGACGGYPGDINARVAADLLNDPDVRAGLAGSGVAVPADTRFVAGLHDTTTDDVMLDASGVDAAAGGDRDRLSAWLQAAGNACRRERAAGLGLVHLSDSALGAAVRRRSLDWSEVRAEWGLAGNAAFVAAPRNRTRGVDLGGRVFLHDYDAASDPDGARLELIMTAPMVVASWINLQYYASTIDNSHFGSGSKLLHNVVGAFGAWEGNSGDLRVGLPWQSVHDGERLRHEPLRLSVLIDTMPASIDAVLARHDHVRQLVEHEWIHLFALDPTGRCHWRRTASGWTQVLTGTAARHCLDLIRDPALEARPLLATTASMTFASDYATGLSGRLAARLTRQPDDVTVILAFEAAG